MTNFIASTVLTVMKGKVLLITEDNSLLEYVVKVKQVIKQGNKELKVNQEISLFKRAACQSPFLKEKQEYLFMGHDEDGKYKLDKTSFVKLWPRNSQGPHNNDKLILEDFAAAKFKC